ncbi:MAG: hypothetical protein EON59_04280 [Alphaproteobacteria bacterium]|nr:MAG: hypothetical protein EON59_04280 [Alphaproteobacteria bacterium]
MGAAITGNKATLNINLAPAQIEAALRSPRGFVGYFTERMGRALKAAGDESPQYVFIVEGAEAQDFHLHGVISSTVPNLRSVLAAVGGKTSTAAPERQVHSRSVYSLVGWVRYIAKAPLTTTEVMTYERRQLGIEERRDGLIGASRITRARGKEWYEEARRGGVTVSDEMHGAGDASIIVE